MCLGGGGGGGTNTVQQTIQEIPEQLAPYYDELLGRGTFQSLQPYTPYPEKRLAEFSPFEQDAMAGIGALAETGTPEAMQSAITGSEYAAYKDPYAEAAGGWGSPRLRLSPVERTAALRRNLWQLYLERTPEADADVAESVQGALEGSEHSDEHRWARQPAGQPASLQATATVPVTAAEQTRWADHPIDSIFARILANHPPPAIAAGAPMAVELPPPRDAASRLEGIATA